MNINNRTDGPKADWYVTGAVAQTRTAAALSSLTLW